MDRPWDAIGDREENSRGSNTQQTKVVNGEIKAVKFGTIVPQSVN